MESLKNKQITDRIYNKCMSRLINLETEIKEYERQLKEDDYDRRIGEDLTKVCLSASKREYQVWTRIFELNEKNY